MEGKSENSVRALKAHLALNVRNVETEHRVLSEDAGH